jgi:putative effector of murein hydrolase
MAEFGRGITAGLVAGLIAGILIGILTLGLNLTIFHDEMASIVDQSLANAEKQSGQPMPPEARDMVVLVTTYIGPIMAVILTLIFGAVIGLIFGWQYDRIPGKTPIAKGVIVGIGWWVVGMVISLALQSLSGSMNGVSMSGTYLAVSYTTSLIGNLIYGYLLGRFWIKFGG